jgi:hypothetical protein
MEVALLHRLSSVAGQRHVVDEVKYVVVAVNPPLPVFGRIVSVRRLPRTSYVYSTALFSGCITFTSLPMPSYWFVV